MRSGLLAGSALCLLAGIGIPTGAGAQVTSQLVIGGQVTSPRTFRFGDLQALPSQTQSVFFLSGSGSTTATFTGPTLWSVLNTTVGLRVDPAVRNDVLRSMVIATGSDGYQTVYALGELNPNFGGSTTRPELLAHSSTPGVPLTTDGFARTTQPGDIRGGRYVSNVESISVLHAPRMTGPFAGGLSTQFTITGAVARPSTFTLGTLTALGATTVNAPAGSGSPAATFTGVPLWTLLQSVGVITNPAVPNNILRMSVIATGSDGYQSTISAGEINPNFGANNANPIIVAYATNGGAPGTSLGANGFARLVLPDDNLRGRWVSNLVNLELFDVSNWKILAGENLDMAAFGYRTLGFTLDGGTLSSPLGPATLTSPTFVLNGGVIDTNVTLGGTGTLTQAAGTSVLRGNVATPNVVIAGGTLQLAADQRLAATTTLALNAGTLDLNGFTQSISSLSGAGRVSLGSASTGGALSVASGSFAGSIVDGGRSGSLFKEGSGTLTLTGASTFTGPTTVLGGTLVVDGSLSNSIATVGSGASLGGSGRLGGIAVASGGSLAPGNGIGTINVVGNLAFGPGSAYVVEANAAGQSDRTVAGGSATLFGGTVQVLASPGAYDPRTSYTILTAADGVSGRFAGVSSNLAFLNPYLSYGATSVSLMLVRNDVPFAAAAITRNEVASATAVQSLGFGNPAYDAVAVLDAPSARRAFNALSGEVHASQITSAFETGYIVREAVLGRLRGGFATTLPGFVAGASLPASYSADLPGQRIAPTPVPTIVLDPRVFALWGQGFGSFGSTSGNGTAASLKRDLGGFIAGADATLDGAYRFGIAGGYTDSSFDVSGRNSHGYVKSGFGAIYGGATFGAVNLRVGGVFAGNSTETRRTAAFEGFSDSLRARFGGTTLQGFGEVGYRMNAGQIAIEPFLGAAAMIISRDGFTERGGSAALTAAGRDYTVKTLTAAVRGEFALTDTPFSLRGMLGYRAAFGDVSPRALLAFAGGGSQFGVTGVPIDRNAFVAEAGIDWKVAPNIVVGVSYAGQIGNRANDNGVRGNFVWRF